MAFQDKINILIFYLIYVLVIIILHLHPILKLPSSLTGRFREAYFA